MKNGSHKASVDLDDSEGSIDLEQIWFVIREKAWLIALCGLLGILGGLAYIHHTPITYNAQAVIEVDAAPIRAVDYGSLQDEKDPLGEEMGQTVLAEFRSRAFLQKVIEDNSLLHNPAFLPPLPNGQVHSMDEAIDALGGMAHESIRQGTRFIDVGAVHPNPEMARELANMLANEYISQTIKDREATANIAIKALEDQADQASANLEKAAERLQNYVKETKSGSLVGANDTVITDLKAKNGELSAAHATRLRLEQDDEDVMKHINDTDPQALLAIPSVANQPEIMDAVNVIKELQTKVDLLKLRYTAIHPKMIAANKELEDEKAILMDDIRKIPPMIHAARQAAEEMEQKFQDAVKAQEAKAVTLDDQQIQFDVLSRDKETDQALYDGILTRIKEAKVATNTDVANVHLFEGALLPTEPTQAKKSRTLALSIGAGLLLGLGLAMGLHFMDSSLKTVDQAEDVLGLTVLSAIPRQPQNRIRESSMALVNAPGSPVAEAFRSLRTAIYLASRSKGRQIVLFTSTLAGEGKTFCATNFATALAQQGLRTLLIDADLRSPMIGKVMLKGEKLAGLGELLSRKVESKGAIYETEVENLFVMPAGELLPNPAELLARSDMGELIRRLAEQYERIVIDTAPVTAVSDTLLLLEHAQAICLVVHAAKTPRKWILRAIKLIDEAGSKPDGAILNQVPMRMAGAYSYYPGKYGEPEVYGSNGRHKPGKGKEDEEVVETAPRF